MSRHLFTKPMNGREVIVTQMLIDTCPECGGSVCEVKADHPPELEIRWHDGRVLDRGLILVHKIDLIPIDPDADTLREFNESPEELQNG